MGRDADVGHRAEGSHHWNDDKGAEEKPSLQLAGNLDERTSAETNSCKNRDGHREDSRLEVQASGNEGQGHEDRSALEAKTMAKKSKGFGPWVPELYLQIIQS